MFALNIETLQLVMVTAQTIEKNNFAIWQFVRNCRRMANSADLDQTALKEQSALRSTLLPKHICPNTEIYYRLIYSICMHYAIFILGLFQTVS